MKPPKFDYHAPPTLDEALALLVRYDGDAKLLAGGQSLVPLLNFRLARPAALIDLNRIKSLAYIREHDGQVRFGAMTRQRAIEFSPVVGRRLPLLREATRWVGHLPIRSRGTIGGSIAHADPSAEYPAVLTALEGEVVVRGPKGERTLAPAALFETYLTTTLAPDEILTEVRLPAMPDGAGWAFEEFARRCGAIQAASTSVWRRQAREGRRDAYAPARRSSSATAWASLPSRPPRAARASSSSPIRTSTRPPTIDGTSSVSSPSAR
jgi:carbon-monoxide dehydrogenase medium subunit